TFTPSIVAGSTVTWSASRSAGSAWRVATVTALTCAFHASGVVGMTFQVGVSGTAISFCICGLTVSGTGIVRAGTSRGGICAGADDVEIANAPATPAQLNPRQALKCDTAFMMSSRGSSLAVVECDIHWRCRSSSMRRMLEQVERDPPERLSIDPCKALQLP